MSRARAPASPAPSSSASSASPGFRGNKAALPSKPCAACGRAMSWRRAWAKNWAQVKYCSDACRRSPSRA